MLDCRSLGRVAALVLGLVSARATLAQPANVFYVAVNGNDAWTGRVAEIDGNDGPFATVERKRPCVKSLNGTDGSPFASICEQARIF